LLVTLLLDHTSDSLDSNRGEIVPCHVSTHDDRAPFARQSVSGLLQQQFHSCDGHFLHFLTAGC